MKYEYVLAVSCLFLFIGCHQQNLESLSVISLNEGWSYKEVGGNHYGAATVPGTIHTDLLNNGQIEDPFEGTNEKDLQWIDKKDWVYETSFVLSKETCDKDRLELHFNGLDTYADVYLNDHLILEAFNMHREWTVDVKSFIKEGDNKLKIYFHSPIKRGLELYDASPYAYPANNDQSENGGLKNKKVSVFTRKAGYHYGWDWGPRFVTSGIWRSVELRCWNDLNIQSVYIKQPSVSAEKAKLVACLDINSEKKINGEIKIFNHSDHVEVANMTVQMKKGINNISLAFEIINPKLWWPNHLGAPNIYNFEAQVLVDGSIVSKKSLSIGLRSVKLVREADKDGESFLFEINGVRVFAKGANYIPNDSFLPRVTKADYEKVVADAVDANMNMLRVWGGGVYEDDYFYELCDRKGIMVWQDFMFACSMYPGNDEMLENIEKEAIDNVTRLRNHPSIVLWCGNNEINTAWHQYGEGGWGWKERYSKEQQKEIYKAYTDIFHKILPKVVADLTDLDYWPSSPQAGYEPNRHASDVTTSGDMHYWGVWHALHRFEDFDKYKSRFMSEYGFQSFPDFETVKTYTTPNDYDIESDVMTAHQRSGIGNLRIKEYMGWYYNIPKDFEQFLYMSQVLQARGICMAIEAHRRAMPYCMGSLYWQINDCWPVASWSSTDYYHKWKAVHYAVRDAFKPIMISTVNKGNNVDVFVVSDLLKDKNAQLKMQVIDFSGEVLFQKTDDITINKNTSTKLEVLKTSNISHFKKSENILVLSLFENGKKISTKIHYFDVPKNLKLPKTDISIDIEETKEGTYLNVSSNALVQNLYLYDKRSGLVLQDNYFDLLPGETKRIKVLSSTYSVNLDSVNYRYIRC
ncbi:glycoside hydrolase family 2 protein [Ancylomarina sp. 16SWW S1-10-2]|uniref:beta-mannosidase n=1 Tax=Ancylomarina sp. 16SWW S1-10-2 TaxID=2499681 RepID=UPI0012AE3AFA|nr:glycoside hydrolase family 2 protein [Ancylomarina sp. 16SWW S1-10-2]MRT92051.1 glycoside hydrolase family 2 protein [Ancylomarina sp. 16SWW S1-10-2]